jgi:hypothetical protein
MGGLWNIGSLNLKNGMSRKLIQIPVTGNSNYIPKKSGL